MRAHNKFAIRALGLMLSLIALFGCDHRGSERPESPPPSVLTGTRVYMGQCVFGLTAGESPVLGVIGAAVVSSLIKEGLSLVGNALTEAGKASTKTTEPALGNFQAASKEVPRCVQFVRGSFFTSRDQFVAAYPSQPTWSKNLSFPPRAWQALDTNKIFLADQPDVFFEGQLVQDDSKTAITLLPIYFSFQKAIEGGGLAFDNSRHLSIVLDFLAPNVTANATPLASSAVVLGKVSEGQVLCFDLPVSPPRSACPEQSLRTTNANSTGVSTTTSSPGPVAGATNQNSGLDPAPISPAPGGAASPPTKPPPAVNPEPLQWNSPWGSAWFSFSLPTSKSAYVVRAVETETRDGSAFAEFLGKVFTDSRTQIEGTLTEEAEKLVLQSKRDELRAKRLEDRLTAETAFTTQLSTALQKLSDCASQSEAGDKALDRFNSSSAARTEQEKANHRAVPAGQPLPFPENLIPATGKSDVVKQCRTARDQVLEGNALGGK